LQPESTAGSQGGGGARKKTVHRDKNIREGVSKGKKKRELPGHIGAWRLKKSIHHSDHGRKKFNDKRAHWGK